MAHIRVVYKTRDCDFDYVPGNRLDSLIVQEEISHFFRPVEKRWVSVKFDTVRGAGGDGYQGPERRRSDNPVRPSGQEGENPGFSKEADSGWLGSLWQQIETP